MAQRALAKYGGTMVSLTRSSRRARLFTVFGLILVAGAALALLAGSVTTADASAAGSNAFNEDEPWPPFVMVYRSTLRPEERSWVFRLDYTDRRRWCTTLLEDAPPPPGARAVPLPRAYSCDEQIARRTAPGAPFELPDLWLRPSPVPSVASFPGAKIIDVGGGIVTAIVEQESGGEGGGTRVLRDEIAYRSEDGIPLRYVLYVDGQERERQEVLALHILPPAGACWMALKTCSGVSGRS
jgi:hypothetical protein